ncbi:MAG: hypothetical protein L0Y72_10755 [Gemmataceae bacterium]|nr:hypothetical protein [Gemmataceae bacterium]MCI0739514.1 hypothetical protein [Gemmataceae bacterium]
MHHEPLDVVPLWGLFLAALGLGWVALEGGYRLGAWRHARVAEEKESPVGAMVGSILGLLAFLLAFTFSMAANRFEERRHVVLDEANAIGTTYLRARLLPEPHRSETAKLLKEYVDVRLPDFRKGDVAETIARILKRSDELHEQLWSHAVAAAEKKPTPITATFVVTLNELIDLHAKRVMIGTRNRIPFSIWVMLFGLAILGMTAMGYQSGLSATRRSPAMLGMVLAFASVLFLIADLDRGHEGLLTVSQQSMIDLQRSMQVTIQ